MLSRPRIRTVLLIVNLVILLLPLFGIQALRLYESELIRQTEAALISQGVYVREHYKAALIDALGVGTPNVAAAAGAGPFTYGKPVLPQFKPAPEDLDEPYDPIQPGLEVTHERVRPRAEDAVPTADVADQYALKAGAQLSPLLRASQRYALSGVRVVDPQGVVVATTRGELGLSLAHREEVIRALRGETITLLRERLADAPTPELSGISRGGLVRVFLALPVLHEDRVLGAVVLSRTPMDIQKALYLNRFLLLRYSGGLLLLVLIVSALTAVTISRPIQALIAQTRRVRDDVHEAQTPIPHPGSHEIAQLSEAIADMAKTLRERAEYIETFARNVSHEFKTPLAAIHGIVELLRDHLDTMSAEERARFLDMLARDATRMQKLVERLLVLARADVATPAAAPTDATRAVTAVAERFRAAGLAVAAETAEGLAVRMEPETLDSLVANLLENAKHHGGPGVRVTVALTAERGAVRLVVRDDGPGISEANRARVFTPFFTTARETGGTGLGLSIVRSLVEAHGGEISLAPTDAASGRGVTVVLTLPAA